MNKTENMEKKENSSGTFPSKYLVTAIVSAYNSEKLIRGCLDDLLAQTLYAQGLLQIIVVVSGSEQGEAAVIRRYQDEFDHIVLIETGRETLYAAWNRGIAAAEGEYLTNANTDDRHHPAFMAKLAGTLQNDPDIDLAYADCKKCMVENQSFEECPADFVYEFPEFFAPTCMLHFQFGPQPMWRRSLHRTVGHYDGNLFAVGDYDMNFRMVLAGRRAAHLPETLGTFFVGPSNITASAGQKEEKREVQSRYRTEDNILKTYALEGFETGTPEHKAAVLNDMGCRALSFPLPWSVENGCDPDFALRCFVAATKYHSTAPEYVRNLMLIKQSGLNAQVLKQNASLFVSTLSGGARGQDRNAAGKIVKSNKRPERLVSFFSKEDENLSFAAPIMQYLESEGYVVRAVGEKEFNSGKLGKILYETDVAWFEWGNGRILECSRMTKLCPMICRIHRFEVFRQSTWQVNWSNVDDLVFINLDFADVLSELAGYDIRSLTRVHEIKNPVDSNIPFTPREPGFDIAYISRFHADKNPALMLQVLDRLVRCDKRWKVHMVGIVQDEQLYRYCLDYVKQRGLQDNFVYEGRIDNVQEWLNNKSYVLSTSIVESQGLGVMEAMMAGLKPVIHAGCGRQADAYSPELVFHSVDEAVGMFLSNDFHPADYRRIITERYTADKVLPAVGRLVDSLLPLKSSVLQAVGK